MECFTYPIVGGDTDPEKWTKALVSPIVLGKGHPPMVLQTLVSLTVLGQRIFPGSYPLVPVPKTDPPNAEDATHHEIEIEVGELMRVSGPSEEAPKIALGLRFRGVVSTEAATKLLPPDAPKIGGPYVCVWGVFTFGGEGTQIIHFET
ncbi:MAG: hypothetical protein V1853_01635 [bacterium]